MIIIRLLLGLISFSFLAWWAVSYGPLSYGLQGPCYGEDFDRCFQAQRELQDVSSDTCEGEGRRVCLVPLGQVSPELMVHLVDSYEEQYGLDVAIMRPIGIADYIVNRDRKQAGLLPVPGPLRSFLPDILAGTDDDQIGGSVLIAYMNAALPEEADDPDVVLIGVTPLDIYFENEDWRYAFGVRGFYDDPKAVVSTFRMNPESFGYETDVELLHSRARKMISKFVGLLYYGLDESPDPTSPVYNRIRSLSDLDRLSEPLRLEEPQPASDSSR